MKTPLGHLGYCTNIHAGEHWAEHFAALQQAIPTIKQRLSPDAPFGIGLRLSNIASQEINQPERLTEFQNWLAENDCYIFTMNGFPYGGFHRTRVKDQVHTPDWQTPERVDYTIRLFRQLAFLLPKNGPNGIVEAGISTSPLSYRHWFQWEKPGERDRVFEVTTQRLMTVVEELVRIKQQDGISLHLDLEPEPDGLLETADEFIEWFNLYLLPIGIERLNDEFGWSAGECEAALREHVQLCYDVCHFAVGYERPEEVLKKLKDNDLKVGKIQISAALKATFPVERNSREAVLDQFRQFNEPTYLHQVVARNSDGELLRFPDLPEALQAFNKNHVEWRSHFHVPLFVDDYGLLQSTQDDIVEVIRLQKQTPFTTQMEVETYTWEVLPEDLKQRLNDSIVREMEWVVNEIKK
ncbi:metabolite traffic protein EboE [Larkinella terrae]|uniref:Metabolite traffic protein EboE n=1 Tax=Larkinella terrae TaxID=2025311 RepID=A0A7K0EWE2_9BACT|nr:metabolite traffic protein EboE [Larkinella terrae]MRS65668.1 metabolite traffic protein EboE [Larkinella terrae]